MDKNTTAAGALRMQRLAKALEGNNFTLSVLTARSRSFPLWKSSFARGRPFRWAAP